MRADEPYWEMVAYLELQMLPPATQGRPGGLQDTLAST